MISPFHLPLADIDPGDFAQLLIFMVLAIGAAIQHALKKRAEEKRRAEAAGRREHHEVEHGHEAPRPPMRRPQPVPTAERVGTSVAAFRAAIPASPPPPPTTHGGRLKVLAEPRRRARALTGRALLFARNPSSHDRVRAGALWHEVFGPPPALGS